MKLLDFKKTEALLKKYKIPLVETKIIKNEKEVFDFAKKFGFPIILKIFSPEIFHRTEKKLIEICFNEAELKKAFQRLSKEKVKDKNGILLAQEKGKGIELFFGGKRDEVFGAVLVFGLGGILVDALEEKTFAIAPFSKKEAIDLIKSAKVFKLLLSRKILAPAGLNKLAEVLFSIQKTLINNPEIKEIEFNPIFAQRDKISAADFKIFI